MLTLALAAYLCPVGVAWAQEPDRCAVLSGLENLPKKDRALVSELCQMPLGDARLWAQAETDEFAQLRRIVRQLVGSSRAEAATLLSVLPPSVFLKVHAEMECTENLGEQIDQSLRKTVGPGRRFDPDQRSTDRLLVYAYCPKIITKLSDEEDFDSTIQGKSAQAGTLRPWTILAPKDHEVFLLVGGRIGHLLQVSEAKISLSNPVPGTKKTQDRGRKTSEDPMPETGTSSFVPHTVRVPYGVPFVALVQPRDGKEEQQLNSGEDEEHPRELPLILDGTIGDEFTEIGVAQRGTCIDLRVAADEDLSFYLDGRLLALAKNEGVYSETIWVPSSASARYSWRHRLIALDTSGSNAKVRLAQDLSYEPEAPQSCARAHFDLRSKSHSRTIGLIQAETGDCADAGIDVPKLQAFVKGYIENSGRRLRDIRAWSQATAILRELSDASVGLDSEGDTRGRRRSGAPRGRLDSTTTLALGGAELLRQGFSHLLDVQLRCSRKATDGWDYSFVARTIAVLDLSERERDGLTGIDLDQIQETEIELILDRRELANSIRLTLAKLIKAPTIGLNALETRSPFSRALMARVVAYVPEATDEKTFVDLSLRDLSDVEAAQYCSTTDYAHELRAKSNRRELEALEGWRLGTPLPLETGTTSTLPLSVEQDHPRVYLVRARIVQRPQALGKHERTLKHDSRVIAESYRCTDMRRHPVEQWLYASGWFSTSQMPGRNESYRAGVFMLGFDWINDMPWLNFGLGIGYSHTRRRGRSVPLWDGLDDSDLFGPDGSSSYTIFENAAYAALHFSSRGSICEAFTWAVNLCSETTRRILLDAHLAILPGLHFINLDGLDSGYRTFRGESSEIVLDIGVFGEFGVGAYLGHNGAVYSRLGLGSRRLVDYGRRVDVASTDRRVLWSASLGVTWGLF